MRSRFGRTRAGGARAQSARRLRGDGSGGDPGITELCWDGATGVAGGSVLATYQQRQHAQRERPHGHTALSTFRQRRWRGEFQLKESRHQPSVTPWMPLQSYMLPAQKL